MRRGSDIPWQRRGVTCWNCDTAEQDVVSSENYWVSQILGPFDSPKGGILLKKEIFLLLCHPRKSRHNSNGLMCDSQWLLPHRKCTGLLSQETHSLTLFVMADSPLHSKEKRWVVKSPVWHFFSFPFGFEVCMSHVSAVFWGHQAEPSHKGGRFACHRVTQPRDLFM